MTGCEAWAGSPLAESASPTPQRPGEDLESGGAKLVLVEPALVDTDLVVPPAEEEGPRRKTTTSAFVLVLADDSLYSQHKDDIEKRLITFPKPLAPVPLERTQ